MQVFLDDEASLAPSSLRTAAFRAASREELQLCLTDQEPLILPADAAAIDRGLADADDDTWAWRIVLLSKDCLAFSLRPSSTFDWDALWEQTQSWFNCRPASFEPTLRRNKNRDEGHMLPEIWYLHDHHVTGAYHLELCLLLLAISDPRMSRFGLQKAISEERLKDEVNNRIINICGIAMSNSSFPPAMTAAAAIITAWADYVEDPDLQDVLIQLLVKTRELHGWPTEAAQHRVKLIWRKFEK